MTNKKKKIIFGIGSALLILALAGAGVYAWYVSMSSNFINPQTLNVTTSQFLEVRQAVPAGETENEYGSVLELSFDDLVLVDITGDGTTLVRPKLLQSADDNTGVTYAEPDISSESVWVDPISNKDYMDVTLEFRSNKRLDVFLGAGSAVTPHCGVDNAIGPNAENISTYGSFSRDLMAGAARVAFVTTGNTPQTMMVWEPNRNYELYYQEGWQFDLNGTAETPHRYYYVGANNAKVQSSLETAAINVVYDEDIALNNAVISYPSGSALSARIVSLALNNSTGFYEGSVTLRVWIEGCDREARRALASGQIDVALFLYGYETAGN